MFKNHYHAPLLLEFVYLRSLNIMWKITIKRRVNVLLVYL
jgi:hypothetical protein